MFIVGLTGGIGSGKSTVAQFFKQQGINVVDADQKARDVVEPGTPALKEIANYFGPEVLLEDGALDRAQLRSIIFNSEEKRRWLEALLHPLIRDAIIEDLNNSSSDYAILESPLLFETDQHLLTNTTLLVDVPVQLQISRTCERDNNEREQVEKIIEAQMPREQKQEKAEYILDNSRDLPLVREHAQELHQTFLTLAQAAN
ncbi:dephospho-CoA kinase [Litoribrevibacter albus]|uniref:Dephospho-CoA kinase n=1 Tax=Litoribrevibacter albus TaxID=1473156 RepID=A0AA37W9D7_9GAMM|nr:dephospho-CoA kinase [Litoribrevibacter albus]GLQ33269.1 dephospho-CoA kinase [Litoribrevibacter albus]